jgi:hypothetical protein
MRRDLRGSNVANHGVRTDRAILAELIFSVWVVGHIYGCFWFATLFSVERKQVYGNASPFEMYLYACRDGIFLLTDTGNSASFRDNWRIALMVILLRPCGAIYLAWVFAQMVVILQRLTILPSRESEHVALVNAAMGSLGLPMNMRQRILKYHSYLTVHHNDSAYDALFKGLSLNLSIELKLFLFRQLLQDAPFFKDIAPAVLHKLVQNFNDQVFSPGDIIIRIGEVGQEMFFIVKGHVDVLNAAGDLLAVKKNGDYFGEVALVLEGMRRTATIRARTYVILATLSKESLYETLKDSPEQRVIMLARIRSFNNIAQPGADEKDEDTSESEESTSSPKLNGDLEDDRRKAIDDEALSPMSLGPVSHKLNGVGSTSSTSAEPTVVGNGSGPKDAWTGAACPAVLGVMPVHGTQQANGLVDSADEDAASEPDSPLLRQPNGARAQ